MRLLRPLTCALISVIGLTFNANGQTGPASARIFIYPNPTCEGATFSIGFSTDTDRIEVAVYDVLGQRVTTLLRFEDVVFRRGSHTIPFNGQDVNGEHLPDGYYILIVLSRGEIIATAKFVFSCRFS